MSQNNPNPTVNSINARNETSGNSPESNVTSGTTGSQGLERNKPAGQSTGSGGAAGTATALAQEYTQKITDAAGTAKDFVVDKATVVGDKIKELQNLDFNEVADQAKQYARQNPGQAILIAAGAGLLLGFILRGSRR